MPKRHYTRAEAVLQRIILLLEREDSRSHRDAIIALLEDGPLVIHPSISVPLKTNAPIELFSEPRAVLLAFLRSVVAQREHDGISEDVGTYAPASFRVIWNQGRPACIATGDGRDIAVLQLVMLLQQTGLSAIQRCAANDRHCQRLFVRTYDRKYCSDRCGKRVNMRDKRAREREEERTFQERQEQKRVRRRAERA